MTFICLYIYVFFQCSLDRVLSFMKYLHIPSGCIYIYHLLGLVMFVCYDNKVFIYTVIPPVLGWVELFNLGAGQILTRGVFCREANLTNTDISRIRTYDLEVYTNVAPWRCLGQKVFIVIIIIIIIRRKWLIE